jgi:hypothetical protein
VEAIAAEFSHHQKAYFEAEVDRGMARVEVVLKTMPIPNNFWALFGIPVEMLLHLQHNWVDLVWSILFPDDNGLENQDDNGSEDMNTYEEVETDESEDSVS